MSKGPDRIYDLRYLRYAIAAAELGSFRRAADRLGVCQSEVSRRIRFLEDRLGIDLFERRRSGSTVTTAGRLFLQEAGRGLEQLALATSAVASVRRVERGEIQIGILASLSAGFLRRLLELYGNRYRGIRLVLHKGTHDEHFSRLLSGTIDVAFLTGEPSLNGISSLVLWTEQILVALPDEHPLANGSDLAWSQLGDQRFLVSKEGPGPEIHRHIVSRLASPGFSPDVMVHDLSREDIMHLVALGFGLTLTSESTEGAIIPGVSFRLVANEAPLTSSAIWLVYQSKSGAATTPEFGQASFG